MVLTIAEMYASRVAAAPSAAASSAAVSSANTQHLQVQRVAPVQRAQAPASTPAVAAPRRSRVPALPQQRVALIQPVQAPAPLPRPAVAAQRWAKMPALQRGNTIVRPPQLLPPRQRVTLVTPQNHSLHIIVRQQELERARVNAEWGYDVAAARNYGIVLDEYGLPHPNHIGAYLRATGGELRRDSHVVQSESGATTSGSLAEVIASNSWGKRKRKLEDARPARGGKRRVCLPPTSPT